MGAASSQVGTLPPSDTPAYLWDTQRLTKLLVLLFLIFFSSPFTFVVLPPTNSIGLDSSSSFSVIIWRRGSWVGTCGWARFLLRDRRHDFFFFFFFFFYCISMNGHRSTERISYSGFPLLGGPADSLPSASSIVSDGTAVTLSTPSAEDHIETCDIIQCRRRWDISAGIIAVFPGGEEKKNQTTKRSSLLSSTTTVSRRRRRTLVAIDRSAKFYRLYSFSSSFDSLSLHTSLRPGAFFSPCRW